MKTKIIAVAIAAAAVLAAGSIFIAMSADNFSATASQAEAASESIPTSLKTGKYFKENGTEEEYIEVYGDGTIQMFGYDHKAAIFALNGGEKSLTETLGKDGIEQLDKDAAYYNAKHVYKMNEFIPFVEFCDMNEKGELIESGLGLSYKDENTLVFDEKLGMVYKFAQ